jgi:hypothetical protein
MNYNMLLAFFLVNCLTIIDRSGVYIFLGWLRNPFDGFDRYSFHFVYITIRKWKKITHLPSMTTIFIVSESSSASATALISWLTKDIACENVHIQTKDIWTFFRNSTVYFWTFFFRVGGGGFDNKKYWYSLYFDITDHLKIDTRLRFITRIILLSFTEICYYRECHNVLCVCGDFGVV